MGKAIWIVAIIILMFLIVQYGTPTEIKFIGTPPFVEITWKTKELPPPPQIIPPSEFKTKNIEIEYLKPTQQIFRIGDDAKVEFNIINTLAIPYNLTVDWLYNETRYHGWFNQSTDLYDVERTGNFYESWYGPIQLKGDWTVHLIIEYELNNHTSSKDTVTNFKII